MKKYLKIICAILTLIIVGNVVYNNKDKLVAIWDIKGCYVAHLANDVYSLKVVSQDGEKVDGTLVIYNAQKDSSNGPINGTYKNGLLYATYTFYSEGSTSTGDVIFKKVQNGFVRGSGAVDNLGEHFTDLKNIQFDTSYIYVATSSCATSLQ